MTNELMKQEILRRVGILGTKKVKPSGWLVPKKEKWVDDHPVPESEALFISSEVAKYLNGKESDKAIKNAAAAANGEGIGDDKKRKMRVFEAIFHGSLRVDCLKRNDSKSREELDARNSKEQRKKIFWELAAEKYNDPDFSPHSHMYPDFHSKFATSFPLAFDKDITPEDTKKVYMETRAMFNKAHADWKVSGNGCGALTSNANNPNGKAATKRDCLMGVDKNGDGSTLSDDRIRFCGGSLCLAYFWCLIDDHQLVHEVKANITTIGAGSDAPVIDVTGIKTRRNKDKKRKYKGGMHHIRQIQSSILDFRKDSIAARARERLADRISDSRDALVTSKDTLQSS